MKRQLLALTLSVLATTAYADEAKPKKASPAFIKTSYTECIAEPKIAKITDKTKQLAKALPCVNAKLKAAGNLELKKTKHLTRTLAKAK